MLAVIIMGSPSDSAFAQKIVDALDAYGIPSVTRVASAHKVPRYVLEMLDGYEADPQPKVYITVAGRSNALSGLIDAQVAAPVIACPPYSDKFGGADVYSSLRMPSGVAPAVILEPANAALFVTKLFGVTDAGVRDKVKAAQAKQRERLYTADKA